MFPYPSGNGLHVGHAVGYIGSDIIARYHRAKGFNVLHPMGWDAFGLPAEQYAIKTGSPPASTTHTNCNNFKKQLQLMGLSYDWDREINTSNPDFYRWTQFLFLKLYEKGLVYESKVSVWWCDALKTVLANEEVIAGRSERGDHPCIRKPLTQWVLKITAYAEQLLAGLDDLDWDDSIKKMQREWIGRAEGVDIKFAITDYSDASIDVFCTQPEALFGANALLISTEHALFTPLVNQFLKHDITSEISRINATKEEVLSFFLGCYAMHPITHKKLPIYASNHAASNYNQGAIISIPEIDLRAKDFSLQTGLDWKSIIKQGNDKQEPTLINSEFINGMNTHTAKKYMTEWLLEQGIAKKRVRYKLHDWLFSRQRYWGEPFPLYKDSKGHIIPAKYDELPICLPDINDYRPAADGSSPLQKAKQWIEHIDASGNQLFRVTDTMPGWAGSCWYYLRFMDPHNHTEPFSKQAMEYWGEVDLYVGGAAHATMHLLYARFWHKVLYDLDLVSYKEPFKKLFNQGLITSEAFKDASGRIVAMDEAEQCGADFFIRGTKKKLTKFNTKMSKSLLNVVNPDTLIDQYGVDAFRLYMMFLGPLNKSKKWSLNGISGCVRFINRLWAIFCDENDKLRPNILDSADKSTNPLWNTWQKTLKRVSSSFSSYNFNIAVAAFMEFINQAEKDVKNFDIHIAQQFLCALSPFAPHIIMGKTWP